MLIYTALFNNDFYDTGCCRQRGYLGAVFVFEGGCQGEEGFKCPEKRIFYQHIILFTDMGKVGLILNFRHQPVFEGSARDRKEPALSRARL